MEGFVLYLRPARGEEQALPLRPHSTERALEGMLRPSAARVYNAFDYSLRLEAPDPGAVSALRLEINGAAAQAKYDPVSGEIRLTDEAFGQRPFAECYGYVRLTLRFSLGGAETALDTDYVPVMVRRGRMNDSVRRMTEFVYRNNEALLFSDAPLPRDAAGLRPGARKTLESQLLLLQRVARVYEKNYAYFRVNSRFRMVEREQVDRLEKLRSVSAGTLAYIAQHPDELRRSPTGAGVRVGGRYYLPERTHVTNAAVSYDTTENRQLLGFLRQVVLTARTLRAGVEELLCEQREPFTRDDWVESSWFFYQSAFGMLESVREELSAVSARLTKLLAAYGQLFRFEAPAVTAPVPPTPVFAAVPPYREIRDCMTAWFGLGVYELGEEKYMLSFLKLSALYEAYVLLKLLRFLTDSGYVLFRRSRLHYSLPPGAFYENTVCNNRFVFRRGHSRVTLYYQPVIFNVDQSAASGVGLYRNTSISFPREGAEDASSGSYYCPDYLLKIEDLDADRARYVLIDAKFQTLQNVRRRQVPALAYKYLFSLTPVRARDAVEGLCVINGQSEYEEDRTADVYDFSLSPGRIYPRAEIVTLTENDPDSAEKHAALLGRTLGRYLED